MNDNGEKKKGITKWILMGCGGCLVLLLGLTAFVIVLGGFIFQIMKNSDPYEEALDLARRNPEVIEAIGEPVEPGFMVWGSIETSGPSGEASISFPIKGTSGEAQVYVEAEKSAGQWKYSVLAVEIEGQERRINLLVR